MNEPNIAKPMPSGYHDPALLRIVDGKATLTLTFSSEWLKGNGLLFYSLLRKIVTIGHDLELCVN